jgi:hypothetical protein
MMVVSIAKTWKVLPALLACLMAMATVVCLVHTDAMETHAPLQGHAHSSSSSSMPLTLDLHCLIAILPSAIVLLALCAVAFALPLLWSPPRVPSLPPFIPPKALARA